MVLAYFMNVYSDVKYDWGFLESGEKYNLLRKKLIYRN